MCSCNVSPGPSWACASISNDCFSCSGTRKLWNSALQCGQQCAQIRSRCEAHIKGLLMRFSNPLEGATQLGPCQVRDAMGPGPGAALAPLAHLYMQQTGRKTSPIRIQARTSGTTGSPEPCCSDQGLCASRFQLTCHKSTQARRGRARGLAPVQKLLLTSGKNLMKPSTCW